MSESDVTSIHDEDVLRRMWQQAEDFGRKKEIRAHMYRLREERLRNLYTQDDKPTQRTEAKGQEFSTSQGHTKSFADQSFQSIKSKEVRDAGSPPRDYSYQMQDLKDKSNAGWNVESENKITDDGHTHVRSVQAHVAGQYDVDGGSGRFAAVDKHNQAVTEYHDDNLSLKKSESATATSAHDQFTRKTDDGATFSSTTSTSSSKVQQMSSVLHDFDAPVDTVDFSSSKRERSQNDSSEEQTSFKTMSENFKSLRSQDLQGELTSRRVEYPDENTKVIVETRTFPDGTTTTSTRREIRGPAVQTCHSEQRSQQSRSDSRSSKTVHSQCNIEDKRCTMKYDNVDRKQIENNERIDDTVDRHQADNKEFFSKDIRQERKTEFTKHDSKQDFTKKKETNHNTEMRHTDQSVKHEDSRSHAIHETIDKKNVEESHYQTTYQSDFTQKKISTDLSPTHQAWASTLRADTPSTHHGSVRGSSPSSRTSTSSIRSSVSPDKYVRKPSSRGGSPTKHDRHSPTRNVTDQETTSKSTYYRSDHLDTISNRFTSPERKPAQSYRHSPSPIRRPKDTYRLVDEETKRSTKFDTHHTDYKTTSDRNTRTNVRYSQSPEKFPRSHDKSPSPIRKSPTKDYAPNRMVSTHYDDQNSKDYSITKEDTKHYTSTIDDTTTIKTNVHSRQSPTREIKRHQSPPKVSFETDVEKYSEVRHSKTTDDRRGNIKTNDSTFHIRSSSPTKTTGPSTVSPTQPTRFSKSPEKQPASKEIPKERSTSPSKYETYKNKKQEIDEFTTSTKSTTRTTDTVTRKEESPIKKNPRGSTSPVKSPTKDKYHTSSTDFITAEKTREEINRKTITEHPRQLLTPSTSPTRKPKQTDDAPSTGQSSPTTSVSEIMYFSSPRDDRHSTLVTDLDDEEITSHTTTRKEMLVTDNRPKTLDVKRSASPSKIPCREKSPEKQSPVMDSLPRKSSLKKPSSDSLQISPSEKPPTTFYISPTEVTKSFPEHKVVKKDRPDKPDTVTKVKERPPFTRSETYEERCRKILGMSDKDSLIIEAEKTVSKILDKLPLDIKPTESNKTSSSISPCSSPARESSPLTEFPSQRKITDKKTNHVSDFISHEKETGEKTTVHTSRYKSPSPKPSEKSKTPSRESSPTKLQGIVSESTTVNTKNIQESVDEIKTTSIRRPSPDKYHRSSVSPQRKPVSETAPVKSPRSSISPQRNPTVDTVKLTSKSTTSAGKGIEFSPKNSRTHSPAKKGTILNEEFISEEKKQAIIDRVERTLRNISPTRDLPEKRSPSREPSPTKSSTSLQDILIDTSMTKINDTKEETIHEVRKSIDKKIVDQHKETEKVTSIRQAVTNDQDSKPSCRNVSPIKRPTVETKSSKTTPYSRTESPNKSRSISPKKTASTPDKISQSPLVDRKVNYQKTVQSVDRNTTKSTSKKSTSTELPAQRKYNDKVPTDTTRNANLIKQNSFSKTSSVKSNVANKSQVTNVNQATHNKTRVTTTRVDSESEDDERIITTRRRSSDKADNIKTSRVTHNKENATPKPIVDLKITRTTSDTTIKTNKTAPTRIKSKPEINVSSVSKTKTSTKQTASTTTKTVHKVSKLRTDEPRTNLSPKPKSATTLSNTTDDNIIIDIQQAKSSRENSPDHICPTPVSFLEDTGKPRLPDNVREPDDEYRRRTHTTIQETESLVDDIVEITEEEDDTTKISEVDRVTGSDECLLSVTDKVNKFLNKADNLTSTKDNTYRFKETERAVHSDYVADESDECLLSVSEKVSKFASPKTVRKNKSKEVPSSQSYDENPHYQDNYTKMSVNDKATLFVKTAEDIIAPVKHSEPAPKVDRPDLSNVHESLKSDECLLSVSDKVNKFVKTAEQFLGESDELQTISKTTEHLKFNHDHDRKLGSYAKETVSSHAKVRDCVSPNLKSQDKTSIGKITTLRSSEAVKKAKALFENIASEHKVEPHSNPKSAKLTDIGVYKKSTPTDSTTVLHPSLEDGSPNLTDAESEIDIAPHVRGNNPPLTNGSHDRPQTYQQPLTNGVHKTYEKTPDRSRKSPERSYTRSPERYTKMDSHAREDIHKRESSRKQEITSTKSVLSRYPVAQKVEPVKEPPKESLKKPTEKSFQKMETENTYDEIVSSRRGSGKFGVELRRTSVEKVSTERRRSSATEPHHQPCIDDIFDLQLLEQMLEKVVGYEQRRRIRAQMRLAKKATESKHTVDTNTFTRHSSNQQHKKSVNEIDWRTKSPDRKPITKVVQPQQEKPISHTTRKENKEVIDSRTRKLSPDKVSRTPDISKTRSPIRHPSPDKKVRQPSPEKKVRHPSPDKRTRTQSPSKTAVSPKSKTNRFNEYASAYMKKVGLEEPVKSYTDATKKTIETKGEFSTNYSTVTKTSFEEKCSTERRSSKDTVDVVHVNGKHTPVSSPEAKRRTPSPAKKTPVKDHIRPRSPSPDFKRPRNDAEATAKSRLDDEKRVITHKVVAEDKPSWVTNRGLKKTTTSETRSFSSKKIETEKPKYRSASPSKVIAKPTDVITSSYGLGPMDAEGRPLFGIKALRNGANNIQVKGTVIRSEYHSTNGSEPVGEVSVTAYSTDPDELARLLEAQGGTDGPVREALQERQQSRLHGLSAITTTKKFGGKTGASISNVHTKEERQALQDFTERRSDKKTVRQSSVKSLTEKFIKNAVDTTKSEKSSYPKAGLILRTSGIRDNASADSDTQPGMIRTDSEHSLGSCEETAVKEVTKGQQSRTETRVTSRTVKTDSKSFLDSDTKVTGVQDILTRMKNADIVIEDGDTLEDTEARALLNKFLGATVLMAGMESYVTEKPTGKVTVRSESKSTRSTTVGGGGEGGPAARTGTGSARHVDVDRIWDEAVLRKLLEECTEYEQRRRIRARLRQVMAEQEACAEVVRSTESAATEETTDAAERGESLLLPLLQGLLDGDSAAGGERLLAGLGAGDADVVADVRRALRRLRTALTDPATERHPRREALLALADRLEDALDASADRLDGCKRQLRTPRRRSRTLRHTVGVTREELEVARRLVDESDLDDLKTKSESQTPVSKPTTPPEPKAAEKELKPEDKPEVQPVSYHDAVTGKNKPPPITHSVSYESSPVVNKDVKVVRRSEPVNRDKNIRHSIANGITDVPQHHGEPFGKPIHQPSHQPVHQPQSIYQPQQQPPSQPPRHHPHPVYQTPQPQPSQLFRRPSKEYIQPRVTVHMSERNDDMLPPNYPERGQIETNGYSKVPASATNGSKDNVFKRAPLYRPLPPGHNFAAAPPAEETPRPVGRFNNNKRSRMKRANTIDIPKPLNFYRVESDTEDEASHGQHNSVERPIVPSFQPKTDNDRKFLAFIQKNNADASAPFSPAKAAVSQGQNWNSCFGNIKNVFENQSQDRSRSSSSSSARNFWKAADDQSVNPVRTPNYGPRLSRKSVQDLQQMHAYKATEQREPWSSEAKGDVVSASLTVTGPNHANGIVQAPAKPFIAKPIPVNQFSHAPMSAFKPPKKVTSPVVAQPAHVWSPPSYERNSSYESERLPPQTLPINDTYIPSKPVLKSPTTAPWMASNPDKPKRVLSLAASKFETNLPKMQPSPPYISAQPPPFKPKTFTSFDNQNLPTQQYQNYPVKTIPIQNNLAAPQLVKKFDNMKQNYEDKTKQPAKFPPAVDAQKLQIEFYEKQIAENSKRKPSMNGYAKKLPEVIVPQTVPQVYTVTNYSPAQVSTFVPLQQTPDIEKANVHKVDYLPDVVLNEHNQYANDLVKSPSIQKSNSMTKPNYPPTRAGIHNGSGNYPATPPGIRNGNSSPGQYIEPQYDGALSPGEYDPTEYRTVTRVMRGPQAQQATIKSGVTTRNGEPFRDTAAKSLKGALQKFSSPKNEVLNQIERKKREQRAPNGHVGGERFQVPSPQQQRMDNQQMYNQPVNMYRNNYNAPSTPPHDSKPLTKSVPVIKYNNVQSSPPARLHNSNSFDFRGRGGAYASREIVQSCDSLDRSSKPPSPAVNKFKATSPHSNCSTTPSPSALSKSESWHQLMERQNAANEPSPRVSPRKVVSRAKSMHLLSVPKLFEAGIAQNQLSEKRKTVEAYFSGQASPNSLSKSNSQQTIPDTPPSGGQSPVARSKQSVARTKTTEKRSFCLGRSRTMPTINDMKLLDESNADDAFEDLLRETFS